MSFSALPSGTGGRRGSASFRGVDSREIEMAGRPLTAASPGGAGWGDESEESPNEDTPLSLMYDSTPSRNRAGVGGKGVKIGLPWAKSLFGVAGEAGLRGATREADRLEADQGGICKRLTKCLIWRKEVQYLARTIPMDGKMHPYSAIIGRDAEGKRARRMADPSLVAALNVQNVIRNQKYRPATFVIQVLYEQFRFFFNLYFLGVALSQFIPALQVGFLFTYIAPLVFVLGVTLLKEGADDYKRYVRDREANSQRYSRLTASGNTTSVPSSELRVGDVVVMEAGERVPADMVLLRTSDEGGTVFIRTDQLDGETDWKLRRAVACTHRLEDDRALVRVRAEVWADRPNKEIDSFVGNFSMLNPEAGKGGQDREEAGGGDAPEQLTEPLSIDNTLWANTVVCGGQAVGIVVYTGSQTRVAMNADPPKSKVGLVDLEINRISKMLFVLSAALSFLMVVFKGLAQGAVQSYVRFVILFSSIIPISLRVNIDMAKTTYSYFMMRDKQIAGTIVRSSFIPEELGRIDYMLSDKTGTLTKNQMEMKEIHLGEGSYGREDLQEVKDHVASGYTSQQEDGGDKSTPGGKKTRTTMADRVGWLVEAISVCHNVNVSHEDEGGGGKGRIVYQASSPDDVALVKYAASAGLELIGRTMTELTVRRPAGEEATYQVLNVFPFTSETKRMGIILRCPNGRIALFMKGSDATMSSIVQFSDWLEEECGNLARKGLRTLVVAVRYLEPSEYAAFSQRYEAAKRSINDRDASMRNVVEDLEYNLELLGLTGVEDKLQDQVSTTLETLRNAGVKVWMLTGDKVETATCIAVSSHLFARNQPVFTLQARSKEEAEEQFNRFQKKQGACLVIDGISLSLCTDNFARQFIEVACNCPSVVCCRCAPTQKALIVRLLKLYAKKRCAAIGDGGNDVAMIQAADVGIGIEGLEGKQASLAADFSLVKFCHLSRLMLWHGRNSYTRTARLSQFVIHRGLVISIIQAVFSAIFYFATIAIYSGWLVVGYSTVYTMLPVFSLVLDEDVDAKTAFMYPELYKELQKGRRLCSRTFLTWVFKSIYQGGVIMMLTIFMFDDSFLHIISITFTALILTELLMVAFEVQRWHWMMVVAEALSLVFYMSSFYLLPTYFDVAFIFTTEFWWRVILITLISCVPVTIGKYVQRKLSPPVYVKVGREGEGEP